MADSNGDDKGRKTDSNGDDKGRKRGAEQDVPTGVVFRLLIPTIKMGPIIGNKGANIKAIRDESGARVKITNSAMRLEERVAIISSRDNPPDNAPTAAENALFRLYPLAMMPDADDRDGGSHVVSLIVPASQAGVVIGKAGKTIRELRDSSGAVIKVNEHTGVYALSGDRVLQITGSEEKIGTAVKEVAALLRNRPPKEPLQALENTAGPTNAVTVVSYDAITGPQAPQVYAAAGLPPWSYPTAPLHLGLPAGLPPITGIPGMVLTGVMDGKGKRRRLSGSSNSPGVELAVKVEMRIDRSSIGAVLGRGGNTIANIRAISAAGIKIHNTDTGDRLIEISGNQTQVSAAQSLIQACILSGK